MNSRISLYFCRRNVYALTACLLTFSLITMPFVQITIASSGAERHVSNPSSDSQITIATDKPSYRATNAPIPAPAPEPMMVPSITATKVDALISDDGDGKADPGVTEKIEYTVTITNNGTDAADVVFSDDIDDHTTLVPGSVNTQPIADPDTYSASGNIAISKAAPGVLTNDRDPDTGNNSLLTVSKVQGVGANVGVATDTTATGRGGVKGSVVLNANGSFTYEPPPGFGGADSFTYETSDGTKTDTATVTINISGMVWFISNNAGGLNRGTFTNPFTTIASFNTANAGTGVAPDPKNNDFISLRQGTGTYTETDGINLRAQQKLIGNAVQFNTVFSAAADSVAAYTTFAGGTTAAPTIITTAGHGVDLSTDNTLRGFNVGNTPGFFKVNGTAVGSPIINTVSLTGTGGALNVTTSGAFGANVVFGTLESTSSPGANLNLVNVTGQLGFASPGAGFSGSNAGSAAVNVTGGTVAFTYNGSVSKANTGALVSISGGHSAATISFSGTLSATLGTGLQFDNADGTYNFTGTTTLNGGDAGIDILNGSSGTFSFAAATAITSPTGTAFNVASSPGNPNVTYSGTITHNTAGQRAVNIDGTTGGSIGIATVTAGSVAGGVGNTGVNINNANGSVSITTLNLGTSGTRMTAQAVTITGGSGAKSFTAISIFTTGAAQGFVSSNVTGSITIGDGSVDSAGASAFNLTGTSNASRTPLNIQLDTVNTNGGANGIALTNTSTTGSPGGFRILGTGGTCTNASPAGCSGGQIQNTTGADTSTGSTGSGVFMSNADTVVLTRMHIHDHSNYGVKGINVSNFTFSTSVIKGVNGTNPGSPFVDGAMVFDGTGASPAQGLTGSSSITSSDIRGGRSDNLRIDNDAGVLNLTVTGSTFRDTTDAADANDNIFIELGTTAQGFVSITGSTFGETSGDHIQANLINTAVGHFTITGNTMTGVGSSKPGTRFGMGVLIAGGTWTGTCRYNISNNIMTGTRQGHAIHTNKGGPTGGTMEGTISGNQIGTAAVLDSGASESSGITVASRGNGGSHIAVVTGNIIHGTDEFGINLEAGEDGGVADNANAAATTGPAAGLQVSVQNNTVATPGTNSLHGIHMNFGILPGDNNTVCADIGHPTVAGSKNNVTNGANEANGGSDVRPRQRQAARVELPGYTGGAFVNADVNNYMTARNNLTSVSTTNNNAAGTANDGFFNTAGGAPCTQPTAPTLPSGPLVSSNGSSLKSDAVASVTTTTNSAPAVPAQPSLLARAMNGLASFANSVVSLVEPTAHAGSETARIESAPTTVTHSVVQPAQLRTEPVAANTGRQTVSVKPASNRSKTNSHHPTLRSPRAMMATAMSGENITINIGTLRAGDSVTVTFQATVDNPPNLTLLNPPRVRNQGTVSGSNFASVLTDDPAVGGAADPTDTPVDLFDTTTTLASDLNPSNFGDLVTFTATVAETPAQGSVDPTGTVDFIDTSNGNAVVCNDVPLTGGQAQCQTSTLTAGTHNIRADYSGDGNFDPSQSNIVAQVVIACTPNPIVTTTADSGAGSLREAVSQVCSGTTITFNIAGAGPHTITLTTGELAATRNMTINNNSGERITVSGNNAGRVFNINSGKTVNILGLTLTGGSSSNGGAVLNDGALTIVNSTLSGNVSTADGGAISSTATATSLTLINATISGNSAAGSGGGVVILGGTATSTNSTITNNTADSDNNSTGTGGGISAQAGTTTLKNSIVAGNFNEDGASDAADDIGGTVDAASSFNLIGTGGAGGLTNGVNNNQVGVANAGLGALADNGGIVNTHALSPTSAAVETGGNANLPVDTFDLDGDLNTAEALPVDGRGLGFPRNADSQDANVVQTVDIGAFELHPSIEDILDQSTNEDTVKNVSFNIGDDTGSLIATVTATSSNTTLVPNANLSVTGSGGSRNLQITPAANQSGTTTISVTVTATNGRTATDTFDLTVNAVNDPPSGTDNTVSTAEDTAYTFTAADFGFTDPNDTPPNTFLAVKITTLPALGTLTNNNVPVNAGDFISVADINGGLLKFTPAPDGFGTPYTTFTFQVQDAGAGTDLDPTPNTMTINVTGVNDGPINTVPGPQSTDEDVALTFSSGNGNQISVADSDAGANPVKITLTATNGTITLSTTAGLSFITGDGTADATMMFTGTLTAVNTALNGMSFTGTANFSGAASLQIVSDDQGNTGTGGPLTDTDSVNITINAANDPPAGTDNTVSTAEDTAYTFTAADFGFTDPNDTPPNTLLAVKITTLPALGTLTNNNVPVNAGDFIPVASINGGLLKFTPAADGNGTPYTTFTFQVQDNGGGTDLDPTPNTMTINVTAVNDGPVNTVPGPQSTTEDTPKVFSAANLNQISVADVDAGANPIKITLTATNGTLTLSTTAGLSFITGDGTADATMMFTGTLTAVNTALNGMSFNPTADFNGAASLQIVSDDQGNSGSGGPLTDTDTVNISVNAENDAPVVTTTAGNLSYTENDPATAIDTGLTVTDGDSANLVGATVAITSGFVAAQDTLAFVNQNGITGNYNSGTGVLTLTGSSSVANYQTALRSVTYQNSSDNPTASRTVTFIVDDGSSTSTPATRGITINAVNDAPVNTVPGPQGTNQNTPLTFSSGNGNQISVADADAGTNAVQVTLTATNGTLTLNGTAGLSFTVGDGTADATMTFTGTIANINTALNGMTYTPNLGFSGAASLTITTNDQGNSGSGGPLSDTDVVNIQVSNNISIQDAQLVEPESGTQNMIFTVTLSAPAPAGGSSVNFTTQQEAPALNHATAGDDYTTTAGTVNFAAGEQIKTILVPIKSDNKKNEQNETFLVVLSSPVNGTIADGTATGTILIANQAGTILISEFRSSGPAGADDEFVEIHNNTDSPHTVNGAGGGYGLFKMGASCSATPVLIGTIPNGTIIPARGHYLFVGSTYSLANYGGSGSAAGDATLSASLDDGGNFGIFNTTSVGGLSTVSRLDAVGFGSNTGGTCDLLREGSTLTPLMSSVLEYSFFRDECGKKGNPAQFGNCPTGGLTLDTGVNNDDFIFVDTQATMTPAGQRLGAPGPQNLGSPRLNMSIATLLLDNTKGSTASPNRVRDTGAIGPNAATGTLSIRRRFVNNTGAPVTRLRFRVVDISALPVSNPIADLRVLSSGTISVTGVQDSATCFASNGSAATPCTVTVLGTTLETPPAQPLGGALNSSVTNGTITLGTPLAPGASINLQFLLGVQNTGSFKFFFNVEALP
jgi:hypothetical protein